MTATRRKGARSIQEVSKAVLEQLHRGTTATANLVEWLAVDQRILLENILATTRKTHYLDPIRQRIESLKKQSANTVSKAIGTGFLALSQEHNDPDILSFLAGHRSDLVRCWAAYAIGHDSRLRLHDALDAVRPFAADGHFGVREVAWMSVRHRIAEHLHEAMELLAGWALAADENIRRFASEATRPRGVWCEHIALLKEHPELGLPVLERLKADGAKYVQNSVANWLNDASKTRPDFVLTTCERWQGESRVEATAYIVKKALRTVEKQV